MILRILALTRFLIRDFFRSLTSLFSLGLLLAIYQMGFHFGGDQRYFGAVGGAGMIFVCLVTTMLFCFQTDRARSYPLLARLPWRGELLLAVMLSAYLTTIFLALLFTLVVVGTGKVTPLTWAIFGVGARWLVLFLLFTTLAVHLSRLVNRMGSYVLALGVLAVFVTGLSAVQFSGTSESFSWLEAARWWTTPISLLLTGAGDGGWWAYVGAAGIALGYTVVFAGAAFWLFRGKDLLWSE